jgi:RecA/RadA recombinase
MDADAVKEGLRQKHQREKYDLKEGLSTGSTILNLACTGDPNAGFLKGHYHFVVGDSVSGKTFLSLTCLAEASIKPTFDDYRFIYDGGEGGALMNIKRFFGRGVADRLEPPALGDDELPVYSETVEEFYYHVDDAIEANKPFIYIQDSMDSLSSDAEASKFEERKKAHREGKDTSGAYGDNKAKINSAYLRKVIGPLRDTGSILIVINQTRDSFDMFTRKTRSGGHALKFYATLELWSSVAGKIERQVRGKKRQLGIKCKIAVKKNRVTGRERTIVIPIYHSHGIDNTGSCIDYLIEEGFWKERRGVIEVEGLGPTFKAKREKLVQKIEGEGLEEDVAELVGQVWNDVEKACEVKRKRRYE